MPLFAVIEGYRRELHALPFTRLDAKQRDELDHRSMQAAGLLHVAAQAGPVVVPTLHPAR